MMQPIELRFHGQGMDLALQQWGNGPVPVLALHGWLDNSESFAPLAQHLTGVTLVAPDLAGHGLSAHRPVSGSYNLWDDLRELVALLDWLGWEQCVLLGHSRGAMIGLLLAASLPERIERTVFLDGFWPIPEPESEAPAQLSQHLRDFMRVRSAAPVYPQWSLAVEARQLLTHLPADVLAPMVRRNLQEAAGGWAWRTDSRLRYASAFKLSEAHNRAFAAALHCPALAVLASQGMARYRDMHTALQSITGMQVSVLPGGHHLHMEDPASVAACLQPFLAQSALNCS